VVLPLYEKSIMQPVEKPNNRRDLAASAREKLDAARWATLGSGATIAAGYVRIFGFAGGVSKSTGASRLLRLSSSLAESRELQRLGGKG
jgi:hypothetical protein